MMRRGVWRHDGSAAAQGCMKRIVIDLDGTLTDHRPGVPYADQPPNPAVVARLRDYAEQGFIVAIHTARNMRTHGGNLGLINALTLPGVIAWLERHGVVYHEIHVGKPWCGDGGFYVDDKAVRPDEFVRLSPAEIAALVGSDGAP